MQLCLAVSATAQTLVLTPTKTAPPDCLSRVPAPGARCAAASDTLGIVAFGLTADGADAMLYPLAADGLPMLSASISLALARPDEQSDEADIFGMLFHPKLPLLYVWQDLRSPPSADSGNDSRDFEHLLVYRVAERTLELVQRVSLAGQVASGTTLGVLALNDSCTRLYIGNLSKAVPLRHGTRQVAGVGYLEVDAAGAVRVVAGETQLHAAYSDSFSHGRHVGGFHPVSDEVVMVAGYQGPVTWKVADSDLPFEVCSLWPRRYNRRLTAHPSLPIIYLAACEQKYIHAIAHADGHATLLAQNTTVNGPYTAPIVMADRHLVAFGGARCVTLVEIDDQGKFTGTCSLARMPNRTVSAMVYSARFRRLYVAED